MDCGVGGDGIELRWIGLPHGIADSASARGRRREPVIGRGVEPFEQALHLPWLPMRRPCLGNRRKCAEQEEDKQPDHERHLCQSAAADNAGYY